MTRRPLRARLRSAAGFTIIELMITSVIMMAVTGAIFTLMNPAQGTFQTQPEVSDMQQRLRVGVDALSRDLSMAGAGTYSGTAVGALGNFFAPILPYRQGGLSPDAPGTYKTDTITVAYVPPTSSQTTIAPPGMPQPSAEIKVNAQPGCPIVQGQRDQLCGFKDGMRAVIFDDTGSYDTFTITNVQGAANPPHFQHRLDTFSKSYGADAYIAQVATHTYYLKTDNAANTYQLMHYDGDLTDLPVVDNVVALQFDYYGEPAGPSLVPPPPDSTIRATYGPKPPKLGVDGGNGYAAGENCTFFVDPENGQQATRLAILSAEQGLVHLTAGQLTDGPWCPSATAPNRFDADLLRIRAIKVKLRVQVGLASLRGPAGVLFTHAGTSAGGNRWVPDQEIKFDISPRNLNLGR